MNPLCFPGGAARQLKHLTENIFKNQLSPVENKFLNVSAIFVFIINEIENFFKRGPRFWKLLNPIETRLEKSSNISACPKLIK